MQAAVLAVWLLASSPPPSPPPPPVGALEIEQYRTPNGLSVILQPDASESMVAVNIRYAVGSMHDPKGHAGLAHLVEHLMFVERDAEQGNDFFARLETAGATSINAYTTLDHTELHEIVAPEALALALWLESERMERFRDWVDAARVEREKRVIENEYYERVNDRPYAFVHQMLFERIFPDVRHPLHFGPIGTIEQLDASSAADAIQFHDARYGPRTATLVVAGAFDPAAVKAQIAEYFGSIPDHTDPSKAPPQLGPEFPNKPLFAPEWIAIRPLLSLLWKVPRLEGAEARAIEVLGAMMSYWQVSRAGIANIKDESIEALSAGMLETPYGDLFRVDAIGTAGVLPALVRNRLQSMVETYSRVAPLEEELRGTKRRMRLDHLRQIAWLPGRARLLQAMNARFGRADMIVELPAAWDRVTGAQIKEELSRLLAAEPLFAVGQPIRRRR